jgi:predicted metal-dependent hydrolase
MFEALWRAVGPKTEQGRFLQGLIQMAAAQLKLAAGEGDAARRLSRRAADRLAAVPSGYMGLDIDAVRAALAAGALPAALALDRSA